MKARRSKLCSHMDDLAYAWSEIPSVNVLVGDLEIDCSICNIKASISALLALVRELEEIEKNGRQT